MEDIHSNEILRDIKDMFNNEWKEVESNTIPEIEDVALSKNESVKLNATVLYVDMRNSTKLVSDWNVSFSTKIYKNFLWAASKVIQKMEGHITAFDGDRVMAIFIGNYKNTTAVKTAMKIKYIILQINKEILKDTSYAIDFGIGIDTGLIFATRTGIWKYNDILWMGNPSNYAAKYSELGSNPNNIIISKTVYDALNNVAIYSGDKNMWEYYKSNQNILSSSYCWHF